MTANTVNWSRNGERSGAQTLLLLAAPLNVAILQSLAEGPRGHAKLLQETGSPAQTTLRAQLKRLVETGVLEKHRRNCFPGVLEYELTPSGLDLLAVIDALEIWLGQAPERPLNIGSNGAKAAIRAFAEGWSATMLRAISAGPRTLTELDRVIAALNYPALERRLSAMRRTGLLVAHPGDGRGTPYTTTEWLHRAVGPLIAAARWERRHRSRESTPIGNVDIETAFLLTMPLLVLPKALAGSCRLVAHISNGKQHSFAGVLVEVRNRRIASCTTRLEGYPDAWASGSPDAWMEAVTEANLDGLELGGDGALGRELAEGFHTVHFRNRTIDAPD